MGLDRGVEADARVDIGFDGAQVLGRERLGLAEIETQAVGRDQRALLRDVGAQAPAQGLVQQVGRGVVRPQAGAARALDLQLHRCRRPRGRLRDHRADVDVEIAQLLLGIGRCGPRRRRPRT